MHDSSDAGARTDLRSRPSARAARLPSGPYRPTGGDRGGRDAVRGHRKSWTPTSPTTSEASAWRTDALARVAHRRSARAASDQMWLDCSVEKPTTEDGRRARPRRRTSGAASRRAHPSHHCWPIWHAPVRAGPEEARPGATPWQSDRDLRRRSRDPCWCGKAEEALQRMRELMGKLSSRSTRRRHESARSRQPSPTSWVTRLGGCIRRRWVRPLGMRLSKKSIRRMWKSRCDNGNVADVARDHADGRQVESHLRGWVNDFKLGTAALDTGHRQLYCCAVAPVVAHQIQEAAPTGRGLSPFNPVRLLGLVRLAWRGATLVGEGARSCREPDAGDLHVRFDERDVETERRRGYSGTARRKGRQQTNRTYATAPHLDSTGRVSPVPWQQTFHWLSMPNGHGIDRAGALEPISPRTCGGLRLHDLRTRDGRLHSYGITVRKRNR